ncbi:unnamed protein product (macronuclear) [Paramecium tetraurelia]|uniref:EF-hand domain-containing protein n=1 Tax=Paramecium tetraurelia TaxID=5888 RepID=A0DG41_PARTE|nr:uncharacterized protein GSPATT00002136001 [Paramecium tetraurelia]CAK82008.1 unnamed protein product [Paramecium tetraurelia]|eukprot:XP_001449405.1 hypothetical protein (macronuclear) [Paramecium tetraurelia strain d4-2]
MNYKNKMAKGHQQPLIQITMDLGQNRSDQLIIYRHTDPQQEASAFVTRNNLQPKMIQIISNGILKQMKAYDEMKIVTYDTRQQPNYLRNLKQNHLELQQKLTTPSPNRLKTSQQNLKISKSPSNVQVHDDLPTDKVVVKKLFKLLDGDYDGLISANRINLQNIPVELQNKVKVQIDKYKVLNKIENSSIPLEFEDFYSKLKQDPQDEYFQTLKLISSIFNIPRIKVLI